MLIHQLFDSYKLKNMKQLIITKSHFLDSFEFSNNDDCFMLSHRKGNFFIWKNGKIIERGRNIGLAIQNAQNLLKK